MPRSCGRRSSSLVAALLVGLVGLVGLAAPPAWAEIALSGRLQQGGLAFGRTAPGAAVSLDGRPVPVDAQGRFLLGFGRDAGPGAELVATLPDGSEERRSLAICRREWPVQRIEGLPRDKTDPDAASLVRLQAEMEMVRNIRRTVTPTPHFLSGIARPAEGPVSGVFGSQRFYNGIGGAPHSGTDIAGPPGAPVRAAADGVVVLAAPDLFLTGRTVMIDHGLGLISSYAHLSRLDVAAGDAVRKGDLLGAIGATGLATGAHLHWGMSWLDTRLDPEVVEIASPNIY